MLYDAFIYIGSTGWYMNQDQLYYFVVENGKYLLLCGPIHEDVYKVDYIFMILL